VIQLGDAFLGMPSIDGRLHPCFVLALSETSFGEATAIIVNASTLVANADLTVSCAAAITRQFNTTVSCSTNE